MRPSTLLLPLATCAALAAPLASQSKPTSKPTAQQQPAQQQPSKQGPVGPAAPEATEPKPDATPEMTAEERITQLKKRLADRKAELQQIQKLQKNGGLIRGVKQRVETDPEIDAETIKVELPKELQRIQERQRQAREAQLMRERMQKIPVQLMSGELAGPMQGNVLMMVQNRPVMESTVKQLVTFIQQHELQKVGLNEREATMEAIRIAHAQGMFAANLQANKLKADNLMDRLQDGDDFEAVAKEHSKGEEAERGGLVGWIRPVGPRSLTVRQQAFALKKGGVSPVFPTHEGFEIIQCVDRTDTEQGPQVQVRRILVPYDADLMKVRSEQRYVSVGASKILVRDPAVLKLLPPQFEASPELQAAAESAGKQDGDKK